LRARGVLSGRKDEQQEQLEGDEVSTRLDHCCCGWKCLCM
jgi:hypothetical protein